MLPNVPRLRSLAACLWLTWLLAATTLAGAVPDGGANRRWSKLADIVFQQVGQDQGLPHAIATAVAQDGQGFLWVGSFGGLSRWDGYRFRTYQADQSPGALLDNYVQTLHGDAQGRLWIGTNSAGLQRYDPVTDRFVSYPVG